MRQTSLMMAAVSVIVVTLLLLSLTVAVASEGTSEGVSERVSGEVLQVQWAAPFLSGGGYCSEAFSFLQAMQLTAATHAHTHAHTHSGSSSGSFRDNSRVLSVLQHGDSFNSRFVENMSPSDTQLFSELSRVVPSKSLGAKVKTVSVCHSEPGAWHAPYPRYHTQPCPARNSDYKVGRTMFETDRIPEGWNTRIDHMDEVWVPTLASRDAFVAGGVPLSKLVVVPEPVDTDFYRPQPRNQKHELVKVLSDWQVSPIVPKVTEGTFIFLFVGKFEYRKGIHILLRAYYEAFFSHLSEAHEIEDVLLCILTSAYHSTDDFNSEVKRFLKEENLIQSVPLDVFLSKIILYTDVPQIKMPVLYSMANVLAIPSRGEGWGRPHVEAMACGLPVIATNWSGPTAYLTSKNGFPLKYAEDLVPARGWQGHYWAEPSLQHLIELLRYTFDHPSEVQEIGQVARQHMVENYSFHKIGRLMWEHIERIDNILSSNGNSASIEATHSEL